MDKKKCVHHWMIIAPPSGPISRGVCQICGAVKVFENWRKETAQKREF